MKLPSIEDVKDLIFTIPRVEQGQPHRRSYAMHAGLVIARELHWDEIAGRTSGLRYEFTAYLDGDPDADFDPWARSPALGKNLGEIGSIPA
jgi:hypothetical protein